ncbi:MAG TPA: beta-Ala-His dipeptidase [Candidatus Pygmaiobacter gallistercoris]|nr:beta-Ala-His dipeptidase [Candidatus Pygmaiobacter gallistercoris]
MEYVTKGLQPEDALRCFEEISAIPRGSGNEKAVAEFICDYAKNLGLEATRDEANNVVVKMPASAGCEKVAPVMLQGHMDMVCVKLPGCDHDFEKDPLKLKVENGWLKAEGTTLGADNGSACAQMLALMARKDFRHPPLEFVFTSMEEIGLLGAKALDPALISARRMLNMDSGASEEYQTVVSCAGGSVYEFKKKPVFETASGDAVSLQISGLQGGHSAITIGEGRGNGLKLMARILHAIAAKMDLRIAHFEGGMKMNAIVSSAEALITVPAGKGAEAISIAGELAGKIREELRISDPGFVFTAQAAELPAKTLSSGDSAALTNFLFLLPDGMRYMSREIEGLVQCSSNIGILKMTDGEIYLCDCIRTSEPSQGDQIGAEFELLAATFGFSSELTGGFPGWKYDPNSKLRATGMALFEKMFGRKMEIQATHGGLECGEFIGKIPDMDIMTVAPTCVGAHTTEEAMNIESFGKVMDYLVALLDALCNE